MVDRARGVRICKLLNLSTCGPNEWRCRNGFCVVGSARCDGLIHCYDKSDEMYCGKSLLIQFISISLVFALIIIKSTNGRDQ